MPFVYVISDGELSKIGYSKNVKNRLSQLQSLNPRPLKVIRETKVDWAFGFEAELHTLFHPKWVSGEWFRLTERDLNIYDQYVKMRITESGELIMGEKARELMLADPRSTSKVMGGWIGRFGESGCPHLTKKGSITYVGGIPILHWWELQYDPEYNEPAPTSCVQFIGGFEKWVEYVKNVSH